MHKLIAFLSLAMLVLGCAANVTQYYNREGWSYSETAKLFENVLVLSDQTMILDKIKPEAPPELHAKGKAEVAVWIDEDGKVRAVIIKKDIAGLSKELVRAARESTYKKYRTAQGRTRHYVLLVDYRF
jgi:hypothetical protein